MTDREEDRELSDLRKLQDSDLSERRQGADRQTGRDREQADRDISAQRGRVDRKLASLRAGRADGQWRMRSLRGVLVLHPFQLPIIASLLLVAIVFTVSKDTLNHTAISFETRGIVHHVFFHYALLLGSALALTAMFVSNRWSWALELVGILLISTAATMNLIAILLESPEDPAGGVSVALRVGVLLGLWARAWMLITLPRLVRHDHDG